MGKLGKIFGILVLVLAIAVAALSFLLSKHREAFRNRASDLADGTAKTGAVLSAGTGSKSDATFTAAPKGGKESGSLAWGEYKVSPSEYKGKIDKVVKLAGDVSEQRNKLSETLVAIGASLRKPSDLDVSEDALNNLGNYSEAAQALVDHVGAVQKRDEALRVTLENLNGILKASADGFGDVEFYTRESADNGAAAPAPAKKEKKEGEDGEEEESEEDASQESTAKKYGGYNYISSLQALEKAAKDLVERSKSYEKTFAEMVFAINKHDWRARAALLNGSDYKNVLKALVDDAKEINTQIVDLEEQVAKLKRELEDFKQKLQDRENTIAALKDNLAKVTKERDALQKRLDYLAPTDAQMNGEAEKPVEALTKKEDVKPDVTGNIIDVNKRWNFVIINLGKDKVMNDVKLAVNQNGKYVATIKIIKCEDRVSMGEVVVGKIDDIHEGAVVFLSGDDLLKDNEEEEE